MTLSDQSGLVMVLSMTLYIVGAFLWPALGWPIRAGLTMIAASLLPIMWQVAFTDSDAPGFGLMLFLMVPPALGVIFIGMVWWGYRKLQRPT